MPEPQPDDLVLEEYRLVGRLIGLAIYNGVILDVHFPMALYKKLKSVPVTLEDLREVDPVNCLGISLPTFASRCSISSRVHGLPLNR